MFLFEDYYDINQSTAVCKSFSIPLGVSEDGKLEEYHLSEEDGASLLVSGFCGSGKSNYIHLLINATLLQYSSAQVNIWLYAYKECEYQGLLNSSIPHLTEIGSDTKITPRKLLFWHWKKKWMPDNRCS